MLANQREHANRHTFAQQGHTQHGAVIAQTLMAKGNIFGIGKHILDMDNFARQRHPRRDASGARREGMRAGKIHKLGGKTVR